MTEEQRLTPATLEAIRKRAEKATEGPWSADEYDEGYIGIKSGYTDVFSGTLDNGIFASKADMDFAVNAREDIPALLAEVERLQAKLTDATSICLWSARRIHPIHKANMYDWIDELTGEESERL